MTFAGRLLVTSMLCISAHAHAFMPAGGLWVVDEENNGQPGRGFQIEVENEILVLTYYGYRADGTSVFYLASGPVINNAFSAQLQEFSNGRSLGGATRVAAPTLSAGAVTATFSSGLHGTITFPGESPKAMSKFSFGYGNSPDGLLGEYLFAYITSLGTVFTEVYSLTTKMGVSTSNGNGLVSNSAGTLVCENVVSGSLAGEILCVEVPETSYSDQYGFKMSGDRGTGIGTWTSSPSYFPLHVLRIATRTGAKTGLNEGTLTTVSAQATAQTAAQAADTPINNASDDLDHRKAQADNGGEGVALSPERAYAKSDWTNEVRAILAK